MKGSRRMAHTVDMMREDTWGRDPEVQMLRRIFRKIENAQTEILTVSGLSGFDERLRNWRRKALVHFERVWNRAVRSGVLMKEDEVAALYVVCLSRVIADGGVPLPASPYEKKQKIERLLKAEFP
jgi:hypothetical protein